MRTPAIAIIAALALTVAGCGDQPSSIPQAGGSPTNTGNATQPPSEATASPPKTYDCATLLSDGEAQSATGLDLTLYEPSNGAAHPFDGFTDCGYFASDGTYMQATVWTGPAYEEGFLPQVEAARNGAAEPVSGVGDEAAWSDDLTVLGVRVGGTGVTIAYSFVDTRSSDELRSWAIALANIVISRL